MKKVYNLTRWILVILTAVIILLFFLPFSSMIGEAREDFISSSDKVSKETLFGEDLDISVNDYLDMSMYGLLKMTTSTASAKGDRKILFMVFIGACVCMLLFALLNKPLLILLLDIAVWFIYGFILYDLNPSLFSGITRKGGISYILFKPVIIAIAIVSVVSLIAKRVCARKQK